MLDLRYVVEHLDEVRALLSRRGKEAAASLDEITTLDAERRAKITLASRTAQELNEATAAMAKIADKKSPEFTAAREKNRELGDTRNGYEREVTEVESKIADILLRVPNTPAEGVPEGASEEQNVVVKTWGEKPAMAFKPKEHHELGTTLGVIDFERAAKLSGPRFAVLWREGALLERALGQFMLDLHVRQHGYEEIYVPLMVKDTALRGTGGLPKFADQVFKIAGTDERNYDLYLIPTAEAPLTSLHADEALDEASLPKKYTAFSPCFRAEAGAAGRDTRGMIRQHQFDKVELFRLEKPENSDAAHEELTGHAEAVLEALGLHYRRVLLCSGDMGFSAKKTYDLEVWLPGQNAYREISSCSNFGDFQARRANLKYRPQADATNKGSGGSSPQLKKPKLTLMHTLNGSALAIGRTLVAIFEQYQNEDGTITVPEKLRPYMGGLEKITGAKK